MICFRVVHLHVVICYTNLFFALCLLKLQHHIKFYKPTFLSFSLIINQCGEGKFSLLLPPDEDDDDDDARFPLLPASGS